jgi:hypothetical protein
MRLGHSGHANLRLAFRLGINTTLLLHHRFRHAMCKLCRKWEMLYVFNKSTKLKRSSIKYSMRWNVLMEVVIKIEDVIPSDNVDLWWSWGGGDTKSLEIGSTVSLLQGVFVCKLCLQKEKCVGHELLREFYIFQPRKSRSYLKVSYKQTSKLWIVRLNLWITTHSVQELWI